MGQDERHHRLYVVRHYEVAAVDRGTRTGRSHQEQPRARARTYLNQWMLARGGEERHHVPGQGL